MLAGGVSNRTMLVELSGGEAWVVKQALPKLRVAVNWFSDPDRIEREAAGMRWLMKLAPEGSIPRLIFEDRSSHLLAMEAVGQPHVNWKTMLLAGQRGANARAAVCRIAGNDPPRGVPAAWRDCRGICRPQVLRGPPPGAVLCVYRHANYRGGRFSAVAHP